MDTLFERAAKHIEAAVRDIEGDEDFLPFMALTDHRGETIIAGLMMPETAQGKDSVAAMMAALCTLHQATEAAFGSAAWTVEADENGKMPDLPPSECDNRKETVVLQMVDTDCKTSVRMAPMIRENNMAAVGLWEDSPIGADGRGRFLDAMRVGIKAVGDCPADLREYMDRELAEGREAQILQRMAKTFIVALQAAEKIAKGGVQN